MKSGPEVSLIGMALPLSRARKRLTRTGAGPDCSTVWPSGEPEGNGPSADAGKEVTLGVAAEIVGLDVDD